MSLLKLHKTVGVKVGHVLVGGGAPIVVQSMTMTDTADARATAQQCIELAEAGSELVRVTVKDERRLWMIFAGVGVVTFVARSEVAVLFILAGLVGVAIYAPRSWLRRAHAAPTGPESGSGRRRWQTGGRAIRRDHAGGPDERPLRATDRREKCVT